MLTVQLAAHLGVLCSGEDVVKLLLQRLPLSQRPVGVLLVHKDDVLQDSLPQEKGMSLVPPGTYLRRQQA